MPKVVAGVCALAVVALAVVAFAQRTSMAFTLGVAPATPAVTLEPGKTACQLPVNVPADAGFDRVALTLGGGQPVAVRVRALEGAQRVLASGRHAGGYADEAQVVVKTGEVADESRVQVCVVNGGSRAL